MAQEAIEITARSGDTAPLVDVTNGDITPLTDLTTAEGCGTNGRVWALHLQSSPPTPEPIVELNLIDKAEPSKSWWLRITRDADVEHSPNIDLTAAARLFWDQISIEGKTLLARAEAAEARVRELREKLDAEITRSESIVAEEPEWNRAPWQAALSGQKRVRNILFGLERAR